MFSWLETDVDTFQVDLKEGKSNQQGSIFGRNSEGTVIGSYTGKATFTMDEKTHAPQGTYEGTWELSGGTGRFANLRGHGTTKEEFSGGQSTGHWSGTITGLEKRASTQ